MIDRRQLVTSLAAVAAGVTVPSLRTSAAPVVSTGVTFRLGTYAYGWSEAISDTAFSSIWQFQAWDCWTSTIRHCPTALTFATDYRESELVVVSPCEPLPVDEPALHIIGHAADMASIFARSRRMRHEGAFYYAYRDGSPDDALTADAPELPRVVRA
ncbi:hypothetical protein [Bradyrhizobium sp. BR13661]|jgi:hypothetical protein|uniref:hypothetical protein n=1 Tax=Bradyrhizobium sp. BR13661 TaxID=2940622 RepID=UPI002475B166|nr:hypothetical protein [Bradyrhizobium sp. BR13661]MDH6258439.1 hypothetical protein [Bradyrhizobium sp. BR13661]